MRTLTADHIDKLTRGREAALADRQRIEDQQVIDWRRWMKEDARRFALLRSSISAFGEGSIEVREARAAWVANLHHQPAVPPDAAFKRARGESFE